MGAMGGGKFLVLRNPHNRNREWSVHDDDPSEPHNRIESIAGRKPGGLETKTSLPHHRRTSAATAAHVAGEVQLA